VNCQEKFKKPCFPVSLPGVKNIKNLSGRKRGRSKHDENPSGVWGRKSHLDYPHIFEGSKTCTRGNKTESVKQERSMEDRAQYAWVEG
jgi:hypothetical protein